MKGQLGGGKGKRSEGKRMGGEGREGKKREGREVDQKRLNSVHLEGHLTLQAHAKLIEQCELMFL